MLWVFGVGEWFQIKIIFIYINKSYLNLFKITLFYGRNGITEYYKVFKIWEES